MRLSINVKQLGKRKPAVAPISFEYPKKPSTLRELLQMTVSICVKEYNQRREEPSCDTPLSEEQINNAATVGKIAFGFSYNTKKADEQEAIDTALLAFEDGLFRLFLEEEELEYTQLDNPLTIEEGQTLTFIRLTMLAGRMW